MFTHDANLRLLRVNDGIGSTAPRFYLGRTRRGNLWRFRADLPRDLVAQLETLCRDEPVVEDPALAPDHESIYRELLAPIATSSSGPALRFPDLSDSGGKAQAKMRATLVTTENAGLLRDTFDDWIPDVADSQPFLAIVDGDRAVAVCASVRITRSAGAGAHEAGVETLAALRGRGLAVEVVNAWARAVAETGAIPMYSTSWENTASRRVAEKLGLVAYGCDFHIT